MADLATAYLRLKVNMQGAQKEIEAGLNGVDTKKSGQKVGKSLGENAKVGLGKIAIGNFLGNALTMGAQAAAQGIGEVIGGALEQSKNYEQLAGGAQKIFDQIDFGKISADAQNAYKELNMSANEYLEAINLAGANFAQTMGDEAGYNTARQGMLAIADYASGTGRNLDELNEKYQMITRSTSSYQSIADQFAGVLPATSADFLAQAQAAGLLSTEYTKLTEVPVAEYQQAVTAMLTQGVADLGLAQNAMNESTTTVSGSLAMTKAAWDNFLLALGTGEGVQTAINNLTTSLGAAAQNLLPVMQQIFYSLGNIVGQAISYIGTHIPEILAMAGQLILALVSGLANGLTPVMEALNSVVEGGLNAVGQFFGDMLAAGANLVQGLIEGIQGAIGGVADAIMGGLQGAVDGALSFLGIASPSKLFAQIGNYTMQGFAQGITKTTSTATKAMHSAVNSVYGAASGSATFTANAQVANASSGLSEAVKAELSGMGVYIDGRALVGKIAPRMDTALGGFA